MLFLLLILDVDCSADNGERQAPGEVVTVLSYTTWKQIQQEIDAELQGVQRYD